MLRVTHPISLLLCEIAWLFVPMTNETVRLSFHIFHVILNRSSSQGKKSHQFGNYILIDVPCSLPKTLLANTSEKNGVVMIHHSLSPLCILDNQCGIIPLPDLVVWTIMAVYLLLLCFSRIRNSGGLLQAVFLFSGLMLFSSFIHYIWILPVSLIYNNMGCFFFFWVE